MPVVKAQDTTPAVELYFITENLPATPIMTFALKAQSSVWDWGGTVGQGCSPGYGTYFITNDYDNPVYIPDYNNMGTQSGGFDFVTSQNCCPVFAYGLYKVTSNGTNKYFYLDYRDYRAGYYDCYSPPSIGNDIDVFIKYNYYTDTYSYSPTPDDDDYINIVNGELLNIWEIKGKGAGTQLTGQFPNYWANCLAAVNNGNDHPRLIWGPYPGTLQGTITEYRIYRSAKHIPGQPPTNFSLLAIVNSNVYSYTDNTVTMGTDFNARSYYIKCVYEDPWNRINETPPTNTVEVRFKIPSKRSALNIGFKKRFNYKLDQNYPNPFNPTTQISFSVAENSFVTLKIFDILGNEVASLFSGEKEPGIYTYTFDASKLTSGVYFLKLIAEPNTKSSINRFNSYSFSKKMLLLK